MRSIPLASCVVLIGVTTVSGYLMSLNQRLDHAIYAVHEPKLIVAGEIVEIMREPPPTAPGRMIATSPETLDVRFAVKSVILGNQEMKGQTIQVPLSSFEWPEELLPLGERAKCILVLEKDTWNRPPGSFFLSSVVPVGTIDLPAVADGEAAKRLIAEQLLSLLQTEKSANRQRHLILQVAPILSAKQAEALLPFLKSENIWLHRAALAGLAYATREGRYVDEIATDLKQFVQNTGPRDVVADAEGPPRWAAYGLFFEHYFFLETDWSEEEAEAARPFLPLFRIVAQASKIELVTRWEHGIGPLCRIGTKEDLPFLYRYCRDGELRFASDRQAIILAVSRVLNLGLDNWAEKEFSERQFHQHEIVTEALLREGIIQPSDAHSHADEKR